MLIDISSAYGIARRYALHASNEYDKCRRIIYQNSQEIFMSSCNAQTGNAKKVRVGMMNARLKSLLNQLPNDPSIEKKFTSKSGPSSTSNYGGLSIFGFTRREIYHLTSPSEHRRSTSLVMAGDSFSHYGGKVSYRVMNSHVIVDQCCLARWFSRRPKSVEDIDICQAIHHAAPLLYAMQSVAFETFKEREGPHIPNRSEIDKKTEPDPPKIIKPFDFMIPVPGGVIAGGSEIIATTEIGNELEWHLRPRKDVHASMAITPRDPGVLAPVVRIRTFLSEDMLSDRMMEICRKSVAWLHGIDQEAINKLRSGDNTFKIDGHSIHDIFNMMNDYMTIWRRRLLNSGHFNIDFPKTHKSWSNYVAPATDKKRIARLIKIPEAEVQIPQIFANSTTTKNVDTHTTYFKYDKIGDIQNRSSMDDVETEGLEKAYSDLSEGIDNFLEDGETLSSSGIIIPQNTDRTELA
ncbi:hypothetical protein [Acetobacter pasteurianus]|uniref:Uncharacterized protein n=1 Tax=Acetobacter pasteurianus NBRC 3188 TaxID=1226663 RepID=A0A401WY24_ACEPA|nr:hypothetical protein [Acetobacter pasteurianus]GCD54221.1 hypothetical protein NBRC3188_2918 [Acetobacter pasteurianus NBRC 3188]